MSNQQRSPIRSPNHAIQKIYAAAAQPDEWPNALKAIADCTGDIGTVLMWRRDDGSFGTIVSEALVVAQKAYMDEWWKYDIRATRALERGYHLNYDAVTDRHVVSDEEIANHPIYTQFLRPYGLGWFAGTNVSPDASVAAVISVQRSGDRPQFNDQELQIVGMLGRHIEQALRLSIRLLSAEAINTTLFDALSAMSFGVIALDGVGRVVMRNEAAQKLVGSALAITNQQLTALNRDIARELKASISAAAADDEEPQLRPIIVPAAGEIAPLVIYALPIRGALNLADNLLTKAKVIVIVKAIESGPVDPAVVRDMLDLTLSEARLASLIGAGIPPREAAQKLGITEETARTVLKRIFVKTGISRQSELAALLSQIFVRG